MYFLEVVFGQSAAGGLRLAAANGLPGCRGAEDLFCFDLDLSMGDISGDCLGAARADSLRSLLAPLPEELEHSLAGLERNRAELEKLLERAGEGEITRIWYSEQPDEYCGLCWLLAQIRERMADRLPAVTAVKLPSLEVKGSALCHHTSWGEVDPAGFPAFAHMTEEITGVLSMGAAVKWRSLQGDGGSLRAVINGSLQTVPENFYDGFMEQELRRISGGVFSEAVLIGNVLGRYQLAIGDRWPALRVEKWIREGRLEAAAPGQPGESPIRRLLRKL